MVELGSGSKREIEDFMLTRFACYLIAQNGDPKKDEKNLYGEPSITSEHVQNNKTVREMLDKRGIKPEELPPSEDIKKLERRALADEKKIEQSTKKLPLKSKKSGR